MVRSAKEDVPAGTKAAIMGALGYLISLWFCSDLTPVLGYSDLVAFLLCSNQELC